MTRINNLLKGTGEVIQEAGSLLYKTGKGYVKMYIGLGKLCINATSAYKAMQESKGKDLDSLRNDFFSEGIEVYPQIRANVQAGLNKQKEKQWQEMLRKWQQFKMAQDFMNAGFTGNSPEGEQ